MKVEDYIYSINGRKTSFNDFLLELRKQYQTEIVYEGVKKRLLKRLEKGIYSWNNVTKVYLRIRRKRKVCPLCRKEIIGHPALSRKDNKTLICGNCGTKEALEEFIKYKGEK